MAALLWEALCCAYEILGLDEAADGDRLARSVVHAANIIEHAQTQGWSLVVLDLNLDLTTAAGRMMARTVVNFAEYERELMLDRDAPGSSCATTVLAFFEANPVECPARHKFVIVGRFVHKAAHKTLAARTCPCALKHRYLTDRHAMAGTGE